MSRLTSLPGLTGEPPENALSALEHAAVDDAGAILLEVLDSLGLDAWQAALVLAETLAAHVQAAAPLGEEQAWLRRLMGAMQPPSGLGEMPEGERWRWN